MPECLIVLTRTVFVVDDMRSPIISTFWFLFIFVRAVFTRMCFTTHNTFWFFGAVWCLVPKSLALETLLDRGRCPKFLNLENYACFLAYKSPPEMSASACFGSSHFILINGRSLPDHLEVILSASARVILLNSSSSLKSSIITFVDTPLNTKIFPFVASAE